MPEIGKPEHGPDKLGKPGGMKKYRWYVLGAIGVVALLAFFIYRNKQAAGTTAGTTAPTAPSGIDPNTGLPYASEYGGFGGMYGQGNGSGSIIETIMGPAGPAGPRGPQGPPGPGPKPPKHHKPPTEPCPIGHHRVNGKCVPIQKPPHKHQNCPAGTHWDPIRQHCAPAPHHKPPHHRIAEDAAALHAHNSRIH